MKARSNRCTRRQSSLAYTCTYSHSSSFHIDHTVPRILTYTQTILYHMIEFLRIR